MSVVDLLLDDAERHAACDDYNECGCGSAGEHCMYCMRPKSEHTVTGVADDEDIQF